MSDFFDKETEFGKEAENSTVFSAPKEHKSVEVKKKKIWPKVIAAILVVAIITGGTWAVIKYIPELQSEEGVGPVEEIPLVSRESDDIKTVTVESSIGKTVFYSVATKENEKLTTVEWFIKSINKDLTDSDSISQVVDALTNITAFREITELSKKTCGFDDPLVKAVVTPRKGEEYTVTIGKKSLDNSGYYIQISDSDKIYLVPAEIMEVLEFELLDFADTSIIPAFESTDDIEEYFKDGQLSTFDKITITGENHPEPVVIVKNNDETTSEYLGFVVESPSKRIAENVNPILILFQTGMEVSGAYSYDISAASLKKFGLDNPDLAIKMDIGKESLTYKFALQEDGNYAVIYDDSKLIHKTTADTLSGIAELTTEDYYSTWICYNAIDDLKSFTIDISGKKYKFGIVKNDTDDSSESEEEEGYTITHNGKKLTALNFQYLYQYCVTLKCNDFTVEELGTKPSLTFVFEFKDGAKSIIEFTKVNATKYQYKVDGINMGRVSASSIDKVIKNTEKVSRGETISQLA